MCCRCIFEVAAGTTWATSRTNENMRRRQLEQSQSFTAGTPAKLNLSQLHGHSGGTDWDDQVCRPLLFSSQAVPACMSQVHRRHMRTRLNLFYNLSVQELA